ncbi:uncharacterized protein [Littorina saxatilis]|uniref:Uncharacterized protein n=1 Tax=Littorina saxatilis TaxID=31220 RepID=A0AAN9GF37_9CAEN
MEQEGQLRWTYVVFLLIVCLVIGGDGASSLRIKHSTQEIGQSSNGTTNHLNQNISRPVDLPSDETDTANKTEKRKKNRERKKEERKKNRERKKEERKKNRERINKNKTPLENTNDSLAQDLFNDAAASSHLDIDEKTLNGSSFGEEGNATFRDSIVNGSSTGEGESAAPRDQIGTANGSLGADSRDSASSESILPRLGDYDEGVAGSRSSLLASEGHGDKDPNEGRVRVGGNSGRKRPVADSLGDVKKQDGSAAPRTFGKTRADQPSSEDSRPGFPRDRTDGLTPKAGKPQDEKGQGQGRGRTKVTDQDTHSLANSGGGREGGEKTAGTKTGTSPLLDADLGEKSDGGEERSSVIHNDRGGDLGEINPEETRNDFHPATRNESKPGGLVRPASSHGNPRFMLSFGLTALVGLSAFVIESYIL